MKKLMMTWPLLVTAAMVLTSARPAVAQTYTGDARKIAMGNVGDKGNIASSMVPDGGGDTIIQLPIGLIRVLRDLNTFNPSSTSFDPARAVERAGSPLHLTLGGGGGGTSPAGRFMADLVNGTVSHDMSTYRGFNFPSDVTAAALMSPTFGKTFTVKRSARGGFQGVFVGAGPYASFQTTLHADPKLTEIFGSEQPVTYPNTTFETRSLSRMQLAMAIVVGYRARIDWPGMPIDDSRDGIYVAANYRHLRGMRYLRPDLNLRFDTDAAGLIPDDGGNAGLTVDYLEGSSGSGRAIDLGVEAVHGGLQVGFGVNGLGNHIDWTTFTLNRYAMSVTGGEDGVDAALVPPAGTERVVLPVVTTAHLGYVTGPWTFSSMVGRGMNGRAASGGAERRFGTFAVRGGGILTKGGVEPTFGIGFGRRIALDLAMFGTHANLESERRWVVAASIRINHQ